MVAEGFWQGGRSHLRSLGLALAFLVSVLALSACQHHFPHRNDGTNARTNSTSIADHWTNDNCFTNAGRWSGVHINPRNTRCHDA